MLADHADDVPSGLQAEECIPMPPRERETSCSRRGHRLGTQHPSYSLLGEGHALSGTAACDRHDLTLLVEANRETERAVEHVIIDDHHGEDSDRARQRVERFIAN